MKTFWSVLAKILLVVVIIEGWFIYDLHQKKQQLLIDNIELETKLLASEEALTQTQAQLEEMKKRSLEGMLKETNKAVVSGWETLLNAVQEELNKAKDAIPSIIDGGDSGDTNGESSSKEEDEPKADEKEPADPQNNIEKPIEQVIQGERT